MSAPSKVHCFWNEAQNVVNTNMLVLHVHPYVSDVCLLQVGVDKSIDGLASPLTQLREEVLVSFTLPSTHL